MRSSISSSLSVEQQAIVSNIFREFDGYSSSRVQQLVEPMSLLGDIQFSDQRIQSLIR